MIEEQNQHVKTDPYSVNTIVARTDSERIVGGILKRAIEATRSKPANFAVAEDLVIQAKSLAPNYFEVHRVAAYILARQRRRGDAEQSYEAAVQLEPNHAPLRFWFGQLLMRDGQHERAGTELERAKVLAPDQIQIQLEIARLRMYEGRFQEARELIAAALKQNQGGDIYVRMAHDLQVQSYIREAEAEVRNRRSAHALPHLESAKAAYESVPPEHVDVKMKSAISKALRTAAGVEKGLREGSLSSRAYAIREWCERVQLELAESEARLIERRGPKNIGSLHKGVISSITDRGFGFIKAIAKRRMKDVFFHRSEAVDAKWGQFREGKRVEFILDRDENGRYFAREVRLDLSPQNQV